MVLYKVDIGSNGNIMPLYVYKKLFPKVTNKQLDTNKNKNILLKTHNKTTITQLGTCTVEKEHKNNKKKCRFFVFSRSRQAILDMSDTDALNIIKININSIGVEQARASDKCCKNMHTVREFKPKWEMVRETKCYTNMESTSKSRDKKKKKKKANG